MTDPSQARLSPHATAIRALERCDVPALKGVIEATELFPCEMLDGMLAGYLDGNAAEEIWLTASEGGSDGPFALAYCTAERMTSGTWNLLLIAVHPDRQGRGHGARLTAYVEQLLARRGERILLVETSGLPAFARTRAFYAQCGYTEEARIREFYQEGEDKVVFRKALVELRA
jgi:ribosomal protein S18 acetylase RimI-like enzyme